MLVTTLSATHPTVIPDVWARYDALYRGGEAFRALLPSFLPQNPQEPIQIYQARTAEASYTGYVGPIADWFAAKLFSASIVVRASSPSGDKDPPPFYAEWKEDVDGAGTDLVDFVRSRFTASLVKGRSWWLVEMPPEPEHKPVNLAQHEALGLGQATIAALENEQVLDWEADERGELHWAIVYCLETPRPSPGATRGTIVETWRIYTRDTVETWGITWDPTAGTPKPVEARLVAAPRAHGFSRVPLVRLGFVGTRGVKVKGRGKALSVSSASLEGFWLLARLADPQIAHFRNSAALDWNIKRTCYAMPVWAMADDDGAAKATLGAGYFLRIGSLDRFEWVGPPTAHLAVLSERVAHLKDEIYRVSNQLAQGVNNNAAAVGRSGQSKATDLEATEVILRVYGAIAREAIERTYSLLSEGRKEAIDWSIEGLDSFSLSDATSIVAAALQAKTLGIHSRKFAVEMEYRVADALLPSADQPTKDQIREEIDEGVEAEAALQAIAASTAEDDPEPDGDEPPAKPPAAP